MEWICPPLLMSKYTLTTRHHWFTCVHLQVSHLTQSCCAFSVTLTTLTLNQRSSQWFGGRFQKPPPEGPPPSLLQLRADRLCSRDTPDPDSAKMKTSKGVIQGYNGVAAVDNKHQVIMHAEAYGSGLEQPALIPMVEAIRQHCHLLDDTRDVMESAVITADSGFHSRDNLQQLMDQGVNAYIADNQFRQRDPRFDQAGRYKTRHRKERQELARKQDKQTAPGKFRPKDLGAVHLLRRSPPIHHQLTVISFLRARMVI
ncbi:transposase [Endozoicomonas gorgoniicola]|uniref:Transposase n=1 Tax=Endozoicomonas gorgoniicola TaxID=1234144 RepID=A0ABT3MTP2_9GAMM|nr:transposase [Endozoicomonas gorgoniicola]MCW7552738.1 transposase [Endozoicomonas gorgoniicola]